VDAVSLTVPLLVEVVVRAWGIDDPRVLAPLRAENQPGSRRRAAAVGDRARAAEWPTDSHAIQAANKAATAAVRRLEGVDFRWNGTSHHHLFRVAAYASRSRHALTVPWDDADDDPPTIFDE
jgi:hypothetical protein